MRGGLDLEKTREAFLARERGNLRRFTQRYNPCKNKNRKGVVKWEDRGKFIGVLTEACQGVHRENMLGSYWEGLCVTVLIKVALVL